MQEFEKHIRLVMQQAEEEVPPQVWDAVSKRLDGARPRRIVPVYWRRMAVGIAAAAAVVAGVFLFPSRHHAGDDRMVRRVIAEAPAVIQEPALTPARDIALLRDRTAWAADAAPETVSAVMDGTPAGPEAQAAPDVRTADAAKAPAAPETRPEDVNRQFNELAFNEMKRPSRPALSFTAGGNVQSNGDPHNGRSNSQRMMTAAAGPVETTITDEDPYATYGAPISFGLGIRYELTPRLSIGTGVFYTRLNRSYTGTFTKVDSGESFLRVNGKIDNDQHYVGIPLNLYYNLLEDNHFRFYAYGGGAVEKNVSNHYLIHGPDEPLNWSKTASGVQLSAGLGIGMEFRLIDAVGIYLDPSLRYYFDNDQPRSIRVQQPWMMNLEAGLRFYL